MIIKINRKKLIMSITIIIVLIITLILYLLADRYLIEHVEIDIENSENMNGDNITNIDEQSGDQDNSDIKGEDYISTDMSYSSDTKTINIKKVVTGSANNTITYYVANIILSDNIALTSAFAKNKYGTNIIEYTSEIAKENNAVFAINGDYYGFRKTGIIIRNGKIYRDIPTRTGLAIYKDGTMEIYEEKDTSAEELINKGVINTYSFGPALVNNSEIVSGISDIEIDTNFGNHSIQGSQPRTGIGMIDKNHYVCVVVDGRSSGYSKGVTINEFADIFKELGCSVAYNMDGGGSSTMYFMGRIVNNPLGKNKERGTSDIIYI